MTRHEFLRNEILKIVGETLRQKHDFILNKSLGEFTKKYKGGWDKFQLIFLKRDDAWEIVPAMLIRRDVVEEIFHQASDFEEKFQKATPTIGASIEDYVGDKTSRYRFDLSEESQIDFIADKIIILFTDVALPFFRKFGKLAALDFALNEDTADLTLTGPIFKGYKGMILAKLNRRNDYQSLVECYTDYYEKYSKGFYLPEFRKLLNILSNISPKGGSA
jgi:hypothetical protein